MSNRIIICSAGLVALLGLVACDNEPGAGKPKAEVAEPAAEAPKAAPEAAAAQTLSFSQDGSSVAFVGAKVTGKHDGSFQTFSGTVKLVDGDPTKSSVSVQIDTASLTADAEKLTNHLKSPDFFDVASNPKAAFESTAIKAGGADGATHTVTGNLSLHGVTKAITFPATVAATANQATVKAEFVINRKDFGIVYAGMPDDLIKDDVLIKLDILAKPAS